MTGRRPGLLATGAKFSFSFVLVGVADAAKVTVRCCAVLEEEEDDEDDDDDDGGEKEDEAAAEANSCCCCCCCCSGDTRAGLGNVADDDDDVNEVDEVGVVGEAEGDSRRASGVSGKGNTTSPLA